jgi:prevent-host-death family protein
MATAAGVMTRNSFRANIDSVLDSVACYSDPITVVSDDNKAVVVISLDEWRGIQETKYLNSIPGLADAIDEADAEPWEEYVPMSEVDFGV